jgi:hypothetical protein
MKGNHLLLIILLLTLIGYSCKPHADINHNSLIGDWQWVRQTNASVINGPPYDTLTPANTGITRLLTFHSDSTYSTFTSNASSQPLSESGNFKMKQVLTPGGPIKLLDFIHNGIDSTVNHTLSHDSLYISYPHFIGKYTVDIYTRIIPI